MEPNRVKGINARDARPVHPAGVADEEPSREGANSSPPASWGVRWVRGPGRESHRDRESGPVEFAASRPGDILCCCDVRSYALARRGQREQGFGRLADRPVFGLRHRLSPRPASIPPHHPRALCRLSLPRDLARLISGALLRPAGAACWRRASSAHPLWVWWAEDEERRSEADGRDDLVPRTVLWAWASPCSPPPRSPGASR